MLSVDQPGSLQRLGQCGLGDLFKSENGHVPTLLELAYLHNHPEHPMREMIPGFCSTGCGTQFHVMRFFSSVTACDACREKSIEATRIERCREAWEEVCPELYRKTKLDHEDFPKAQQDLCADFLVFDPPTDENDARAPIQRARLTRSYVFFGPSGTGKTRLAFVLLKRAMIHGNKTIAAMFDEQLQEAKSHRERSLMIAKWSAFDVLLLDDAMMTGAQDEATTSFMKSLLDAIMRKERRVIITTQITREEYTEQLRKFDSSTRKTTAADEQRNAAVVRRISEMCGDPIEFYAQGEPPPAGPKPDLF